MGLARNVTDKNGGNTCVTDGLNPGVPNCFGETQFCICLFITQFCIRPFITLLGVEAMQITHWGRVTHICVVELTIIGSDNGLSPERRQAIIWTNAGILLIGPSGTNFTDILIGIKKINSRKCTWTCRLRNGVHLSRPQCDNWMSCLSPGRWYYLVCMFGCPLLVIHNSGIRDKMAAIFQTIYSKAFSWIIMFKFRLIFHWNLFPRVQLIISQRWFR